MENPLLSIITTVYNTENYLPKCLDSILEQSYSNIEIIVVDDASPGEVESVVEKYKGNGNIKYIKLEENKGLFCARVAGAEKATGKYIAFMDSDDYVSLDFYRQLIEEAEKGDFEIVAGDTVVERENGEKVKYTLHDEALDELKLYGDDVRKTFYAQEGNCYSWHTVWNKIYKKELFDECLPEYRKIKTHLIMTEDIAFSSVLFYKAKSFSSVQADAYFYVQRVGASTDIASSGFNKLVKDIKDVTTVFDFLEEFLKKEQADECIIDHYENFRMKFYMEWNNIVEKFDANGAQKERLEHCLSLLKGNIRKTAGKHCEDSQHYFDMIQATWYDGFERIKQSINDKKIKVVSFDVFDTLLLRPLWNPEDVFALIQNKFEELFPKAKGVRFVNLRRTAESSARMHIAYTHPGYEDVNLHEIYMEIGDILGANETDIAELESYERELELFLSQRRECGKKLLDFAKHCNKKVVLISDMYLERETIEKMLQKNGIFGYDELFVSSEKRAMKGTGHLFEMAVSELDVLPSEIMHIGDNYQSDYLKAKECGMKSMFLPSPKDRFCNNLQDMPTNFCSKIGSVTGYSLTAWDILLRSFGLRSMMAMVANKFFDNPFRHWVSGSDLGASLKIVGYYTIGMHLVGIGKWIIDKAKNNKVEKICFLSRDGYLPQKTFEKIRDMYGASDIDTEYVPCSRRSVLPWTIDNSMGLLNIPVAFDAHSPKSLIGMLECCIENLSDDEIKKLAENSGWTYNKKFASELEYYRWMDWFKNNIFSEDALNKAKKIARDYYRSVIPEGAMVFDLGYSGSTMVSLQRCLGYPVKFVYIHHENNDFLTRKERYGLDAETMYSFVPCYSDLIREYFLSEANHSCVGLEQAADGSILPVYEDVVMEYSDQFIIDKIQNSALDFVDDFNKYFGEYADIVTYEPVMVSMPFEGLIQNSSYEDRRILLGASSEDMLWGGQSYISMFWFWQNQPGKEISKLQHAATTQNAMKEFFLFPYDRVKEGSKVIIYGAGKVGRDYIWQLGRTNYCKVLAVVDTNFQGKPGCESPERLRTVDYDYIICAVGTDGLYEEIKKRIYSFGLSLDRKVVYVGRVNRMEF